MADENAGFLSYTDDGPITIASVRNSTMLDGTTVTEFGEDLISYIEAHPGRNILLDFARVDYLASSALSELIRANDAIVSGGGSLRICGVTPQIFTVFEITNFDKSFDIKSGESVEHASARFKRSIELEQESETWEDRPGT